MNAIEWINTQEKGPVSKAKSGRFEVSMRPSCQTRYWRHGGRTHREPFPLPSGAGVRFLDELSPLSGSPNGNRPLSILSPGFTHQVG